MRVLLTTDTIGGVWTFTRELTQGLLEHGNQVALVSLGRVPSPSQQAWCDVTRKNFPMTFGYVASDVPLEWMDDNRQAYTGAEPELLKLIDALRPDVVHASQMCFGALPVSVPKVVTIHSDVLSWAETCRPEGLADSPWLRQYRALTASGVAGADVLVAPTEWMADAFERGFGPQPTMRVIPNGRTLVERKPAAKRLLQAVIAGRRWDEAKQVSLADGLDAAIPIVVAGDTAVADPDGLPEDDLHALFRASSIYVAASIYEPFGLAALEAALCGCAVVANDIASLREVWGEAATYFRGARELRTIFARWSKCPEELKLAQMRSERRALTFTADRMVESYLALYEELTNHGAVTPRVELEAHAGAL